VAVTRNDGRLVAEFLGMFGFAHINPILEALCSILNSISKLETVNDLLTKTGVTK
jgi:hypothetical protein